MQAHRVFLSLGSNLGDRIENLRDAVRKIEDARVGVIARSSIYETAPQDVTDQPWFLNVVLECRTDLEPSELLTRLLEIELELGRDRSADTIRRGPRLIDIDVLLFDDRQVETASLTIPHPRLIHRRFVLEPLIELDEELRYPGSDISLKYQLSLLLDQPVFKLTERL